MIYTVTLNPALDYTVSVKNPEQGRVNRAFGEQFSAGGKGLNVSVVLTRLGVENTALGFIGGFVGEEIKRRFEMLGGASEFIHLRDGVSRINVKIKADSETEINARGPEVDDEAAEKLLKKLEALSDGDALVLAGSVPPPFTDTLYADILKRLDGREVMTVVDADGTLLKNTLRHRPFLIKPNNHELGDIFGVNIDTRNDAAEYAKKLQDMGARNVLVSMAGSGAMLLAEDGAVYKCDAPRGEARNSVGAGDSMVAGFIAGMSGGYENALRLGIAAGSATAFSRTLATKAEIEKIYNSIGEI